MQTSRDKRTIEERIDARRKEVFMERLKRPMRENRDALRRLAR